jgi:hypothetical protein
VSTETGAVQLDVGLALALMEANEAEEAVAGICEHADAWVAAHWGKPTQWAEQRGASTDPDYGLGYWANYETHQASEVPAETWRGGWFEWGLRNTEDFQYIDPEDIRGSNAFYAGVAFEAKANPVKIEGNEAWVNARLAETFVSAWFAWHRLVRLKYPDELLAQTTLETQGQALGEWVVEAFERLAQNAPPR